MTERDPAYGGVPDVIEHEDLDPRALGFRDRYGRLLLLPLMLVAGAVLGYLANGL